MSNLLSGASLALSIVAVILSAWLAYRQLVLSRNSQEAAVIVELVINQARDPGELTSERYIIEHLNEYDVNLGISQLPSDVRIHFDRVALFYGAIGSLVAFDMVREGAVLSMLGYRGRQMWITMEPYILMERRIGNPVRYRFFEHMYCLLERNGPAEHYAKLKLLSIMPS